MSHYKIRIIILSWALHLFTCGCCFSQQIHNVSLIQDGKNIILQYDLDGPDQDMKFNISVSLSTDGGTTFGKTLQKVTGDCGLNIFPGKNKRITWEVLSEQENLISDNVVFRISAELVEKEKTNMIKSYGDFNYEMVFVRGGTFQMGSLDGQRDERPVHDVTLDDFFIGKYEVTQEQWRQIMNSDPTDMIFKRCINGPVNAVSWIDIQEFIIRLNEKKGTKYRLPTEAEWEYAARGGGKSKGYKYSGSDYADNVAWYRSNSGNQVLPVGTKLPNELGIYDMSGNVFEFCSDYYSKDYYNISPKENPQGPITGNRKVLRGGRWGFSKYRLKTTYRDSHSLGYCDFGVGFRLANSSGATSSIEKNGFSGPAILYIVKELNIDYNIPVSTIKFKNHFAIVIGNEDYSSRQPGISPESNVPFARKDASIFSEYLVKTLGFEEKNVVLLLDATYATMLQEIDRISKIVRKTGSGSEIIFYYAGHGFPDFSTRTSYIIPVDVNISKLSNAIKLSDIISQLAESEARHIILFLDACFTGSGRETGLIAGRSVRIKPKEEELKNNMLLFSATNGDQQALSYKGEKHGLFTYFLLKKWKESLGKLSYGELTDYLSKTIPIESLRINRVEQDPEVRVSDNIKNIWREWPLIDD